MTVQNLRTCVEQFVGTLNEVLVAAIDTPGRFAATSSRDNDQVFVQAIDRQCNQAGGSPFSVPRMRRGRLRCS